MTHMPPIPEAASAPYPPHPAPIPEERKQAAAAAEEAAVAGAEADAAANLRRKRAATAVGMGLGTVLLVGVAAWGLRLYSRRKPVAPRAPTRRRTDQSKRGKNQDRSRVAAGQPYEVGYFARKHGISATEARAIIKQAGPSRKDANRLAQARKA